MILFATLYLVITTVFGNKLANEGWRRLSFDLTAHIPTHQLFLDHKEPSLITFTGCACAGDRIQYELDGKTMSGETYLCEPALCPTDVDFSTFGCRVDWKTCIGHLKVMPKAANLTVLMVPGKISIGEVFYRLDTICKTIEDDGVEKEIPCCRILGQCNESIQI